jgi:NADPH2:quinone reductase
VRAVQVTRLDGPEALEVVDVAEPSARPDGGPELVAVDVAYAGVAWPDLLLTRGQYQLKPEPPFSPGAEVSGIVRSAPAGSGLEPGQRVAVVCGVGGWQETVVTPAASVLPLPDAVSLRAGAGVAFNYLTVQFALRRRGRLAAGETVLVHGASGGIGVATLQLAKGYGARTIAVVSTEEKVAAAKEAGADEVVLADGFLAKAKELTGGRGVDLVMDPVGGDRFTDSLRSLAPEGRLLVVGFTGGEIPTVKVNRLLLNNLDVVGVGWGAFLMSAPGDFMQAQWAEVAAMLADGRVRAVEGPAYDLTDAKQALLDMDARTLTGKALLTVRGG